MDTRLNFIHRLLRQVYGGQPQDDSSITINLVNKWLNDATAVAAKKNYTDNLQLDGIAYVNNSFYTTFKGLAVSPYEQFSYQLSLPQVPIGISANQGVGTLQFIDSDGNVSDPAIPLSENQVGYFRGLRPPPNKILYYPEGQFLYAISTLQLDTFTGKVRMISGGNTLDLTSIVNVPEDYFPIMVEYVKGQLAWERAQPKELTNDGEDA
jgi:hypothetical protein